MTGVHLESAGDYGSREPARTGRLAVGCVWLTCRSRGKRNNGSKRKAKVKLQRAGIVQAWLRDGFKLCSVNCAGISAFKIFLLLE